MLHCATLQSGVEMVEQSTPQGHDEEEVVAMPPSELLVLLVEPVVAPPLPELLPGSPPLPNSVVP